MKRGFWVNYDLAVFRELEYCEVCVLFCVNESVRVRIRELRVIYPMCGTEHWLVALTFILVCDWLRMRTDMTCDWLGGQ